MQQPVELLPILKRLIDREFEVHKQDKGAAVARIGEVSVTQEHSVLYAAKTMLRAEFEQGLSHLMGFLVVHQKGQ